MMSGNMVPLHKYTLPEEVRNEEIYRFLVQLPSMRKFLIQLIFFELARKSVVGRNITKEFNHSHKPLIPNE